MKPAKDCKNRFEDIVAFVMGELDPTAAHELQEHMAVCDKCRATHGVLEEEEKEVRQGFEAMARILGPGEPAAIEGLDKRQGRSRVQLSVTNNHFFERVRKMILAHKRLSMAAATATALAASLIVYVFLLSSASTAYALEQTVRANNRVTSYHAKATLPPKTEGVKEAWVQLNSDGAPLRVRMDVVGGNRGDRVAIVSKDRCMIWSEAKHLQMIVVDKQMIKKAFAECMQMRPLFDPKLAFESLQADEKAGKLQVKTEEPAEDGKPITLTVTSKRTPDKRKVYEVNSQTKLVERVTEYALRGGKWEQVSEREYLDYNKEIDQKVFQPEMPKDTFVVDQTKLSMEKIGLPQGDLTDEEIMTKLAKECFEALIAGDYQKAGLLNDGIPAEMLAKSFENAKVKFLRIVEIGKPQEIKEPRYSVKIFSVPVKMEIEQNGKKAIKDIPLRIRRMDPKSDRWSIAGGL